MPSSTEMICRGLPEDLVEEILCHIPAANLKLIRSTCKAWNRLFNDKRFARKHSEISPKESLLLFLTCEFSICPMRVINLHGKIDPSLVVKSEVSSLYDPNSSPCVQFYVSHVFHCDAFLLCSSVDKSRIVVWNPCTAQTKWLDTPRHCTCVLGYYQDKNYCSRMYKILSYNACNKESHVYEFSSDSWRIIDHDIAPGCSLAYSSSNRVSLKGTTFGFAREDTKEDKRRLTLLRFDFETEKFLHVPLPCNWPRYEATSLSVINEEKLAVLLQRKKDSTTEIWLTNKIDLDAVALSWTKVLALNLRPYDIQTTHDATFLLDEETKILLLCETWIYDDDKCKDMVYIIKEGDDVTPVDLEEDTMGLGWPIILNYVPSLAQIGLARGKRKRAMASPPITL